MKIVFVSNFINHHQTPIADEFYRLTDQQYWFVATEPIPESFLLAGYPDCSDKPYLIKTYESEEQLQKAKELIAGADVIMCGSAPEELVRPRIQANKLTFRYSERWFKDREWWQMGPRGWKNIFCNHWRYKNRPLYMLAASAYTANDVYHWGLYRDKVYKWGYFPEVKELNTNGIRTVSYQDKIRILWCARFIAWKHPELPIQLAHSLKQKGYNFEINMYGNGEEKENAIQLAHQLGVNDCVSFCGNLPNAALMEQMRQHQIFLFTSDKNEGWGAVLNEAMSNGCAVVASDMIGAVPFLIKDKENGLIFQSENLESLYIAVKKLLDDIKLRQKISQNASITMQQLWNPKHAAKSFIELVKALLHGKKCSITEGPCSKAYPQYPYES